MRKPFHAAAACILLVWFASFAAAALYSGWARAQTAIPYTVEIEGAEGALEDLMYATSRLVSGQGTPPFGLAGLRQRAISDVGDFQAVLRSQGYYGGRVSFDIDTTASPLVVHVTVVPGDLFRVFDCSFVLPAGAWEFATANCAALGLASGTAARAATILEGQNRLLNAFLENGYPDAAIDRRAVVDHDGAIMTLTFTITPGERVLMGSPVVTGVDRTNPDFVSERQTWEDGTPYDVRLINSYRERLGGLALFDSITIAPDMSDESPRPIAVTVTEGPPRTVGGGLRYATTEGIGLNAFWRHRNFFGEAETLRVDLGLAELAQSLAATYSLPHRPNPEQRLDFTWSAAREETDAYSKLGSELTGALTTPIAPKWRARIGAGLQVASIDDGTGRLFSATASIPADIFYDNSNSLLDPTDGERLNVRTTAVAGKNDGFLVFLKAEAEATAYRPLTESGTTVIAGRAKIGTIFGASADQVPADRRLYSGGGGSVRGFAYQSIGPLAPNGDPQGGVSVAELGIEIRQRILGNYGAVAFVEAGSVGRGLTDFEMPRIGAGVGLRYCTAFGPIRADVGMPINPRSGDASFQIYISIGQAF
jgi:translocation and assembly module TamA